MVVSILFCAALSCAMPFEHGGPGAIVLPVALNGQGPFRFLLDTGATHTILAPRTAARIAATPVARSTVGSAAGSTDAVIVRVERLRIGPVEAAAVTPSVLPLDGIDAGLALDGILGQDVLAGLRYTIDYRARRIVWLREGATTPRRSALRLEPVDGRFVVTLEQPDRPLRLVPDSGAATLLLFEGTPVDLRLDPGPARLDTLGGSTTARTGRTRLTVGPLRGRDLPVVVVGRRAGIADGLLPLHLFDRVTVDGPGRTLLLE